MRSTGPNGSVASPSRLSNEAVLTNPVDGIGASGTRFPLFGDAGPFFMDRVQGTLPADTSGRMPPNYRVNKEYAFPNTAGITEGQNPVTYNQMLSRVVQTNGKPSAGLTYSTKRYPNASWRHEFRQWAQRFPVGPAPSGRGRLAYVNRYYPQNLPTQITGLPITGGALAGQGTSPRSASPAFVQRGGRGMRKPYFNRQTRLASGISYSSTTQLLNPSIFNEGPLGMGGVSGG